MRRIAALMEVLPLQIPALRPNSADKAGSSGGGVAAQASSGSANSSGSSMEAKSQIPYVKLCGLRLPDTLSPPVDDLQSAQVMHSRKVHQARMPSAGHSQAMQQALSRLLPPLIW
jgi:hypothetical protein